jgi:tetratricopeptide (TPR) repeat protein
MPSCARAHTSNANYRRALAFTAALLLAACSSTPVPKRAERADIQLDQSGFTIIEEPRIGGEARADYENATRLLQQEQYEQGIALLVKVTQNAPEVTAPHIDLGIAYARIGDLAHAEESLKRAIQINPRHPVAHNELGMVYRRKGQFATAKASYEQALAVFPGFHVTRRNLGILCDLYLADLSCALDNYEAYRLSVPEDQEVAKWVADLRSRASR